MPDFVFPDIAAEICFRTYVGFALRTELCSQLGLCGARFTLLRFGGNFPGDHACSALATRVPAIARTSWDGPFWAGR